MLWGTHLVQQGFTRAYGANLRRIIAAGTRNRILSFLSGLSVTALLQSSTATALIAISFAKKNLLTLTGALAIMIGADISTTLVAQVLSLDLSWLSPVLLTIGIFIYLSNKHKNLRRHMARIFIGLGLMLLALGLIQQAAAPLGTSNLLELFVQPLKNDIIFAILASALITWIMHSSLAAVLLFSSLASVGIIDLELGLLMVFGANLGGAFVPFAVTFKDGPVARQIAFGNILMRLITLIVALLMFDHISTTFATWPTSAPAHQIIHFHTAFNVALALIFLPSVSIVAFVCKKLIPNDMHNAGKNQPQYLDDKALDVPALALAGAARETLHMAELVEDMLEKTIQAFEKDDKDLVLDICRSDNHVDTLHKAIKLYLTQLTLEDMDGKEEARYIQILTFSTNLEHIGDIIDKNLMELANKKIRKQEAFSEEGFSEIKEFHDQVLENFKLSQAIFLSEDPNLAKELVAGKKYIREAADATSEQHFQRLSDGQSETLATSSLHLDVIRDYRRINSYATRVAYSILEARKTT